MRRSQAPSIRSVAKSQSKNEKAVNTPKKVPSQTIRSVDAVLNLLFESDVKENRSGNSDKEELHIDAVNLEGEEICAGEKEIRKPDICNSVDHGTELVRIFNVVYCKQSTRKHKVWEGDGTLEVGSKCLTLKDDKGKILGTTSSRSKTVEEGTRLFVGNKEVEVIELACQNSEVTKKELSPIKQTIKKRKITSSGKRFVIPFANSVETSESRFILPEPNAEHQWHFNENGLPITQVCIDSHLAKQLRQHQCIGITFLYECIMGFKSREITGAILADEMGLGKTLQTIALIWTLLKQGPYGGKPVLKKVLVVTPSSLTMNWHNEFLKWLGRERLVPYVVDSKMKPQTMSGPVMIISYEMFVRYFEEMKSIAFDLLVCDEGHRLKNSNIRTTQLLLQLDCSRRIILTGTPIQNDLKEFYTLADFVNPNILGTPSEFRRCFEEPILASRQPDAQEDSVLIGEECAAELNRKISLFLLRRTKDVISCYLPSKNELVVFCKATDIQRQVYNYLINSVIDNAEKLFGFSDGHFHLGIITSLKKVCNHPGLLWMKDEGEENENMLLAGMSNTFSDVKKDFRTSTSSKLMVVVNFLEQLKEKYSKERVVLVSNSTQTLNLLERKMTELGHSTCRLDGSVPASQRTRIVDAFNRPNSSVFVFLLSSKAGGVGLNLTGASRLILYDSDWNPATDLQAMSRIWRDGQKHSVYIYRLLTSRTIEEKIYQRQINKQGLCDGIVDPQKSNSIKLSREEIKDIFSYCDDLIGCSTHEALSCKCTGNGDIPAVDEEERECQLVRSSSSSLKMNELFHWEHHGPPLNTSLLEELCLTKSESSINFMFRSCRR